MFKRGLTCFLLDEVTNKPQLAGRSVSVCPTQNKYSAVPQLKKKTTTIKAFGGIY